MADATANGGAGLWFTPSNPIPRFASSTPTFEALVQVPTTGSTTVYVGFTNESAGSTGYESAPTAGAFFTASSSYGPNWDFSVVTSASASTTIDTGISSTTAIFLKIQADAASIEAWVGSATLPLTKVYSGTNGINSTAMSAGAYFGRGLGGSGADQISIHSMELWQRKPYMWFNY